jgi:Ca2+-binding EF-hand superfamily protein
MKTLNAIFLIAFINFIYMNALSHDQFKGSSRVSLQTGDEGHHHGHHHKQHEQHHGHQHGQHKAHLDKQSPVQIRPFDKVYSEEEINGFKSVWEAVPSYRKDDDSIDINDYGIFLTGIKFPHTAETLEGYMNYLRATTNGRFSFKGFVDIAKVQHDPKEVLKVYAEQFDKDKDGSISPEEFKVGIDTLHRHDPEHFSANIIVPFEQFLEEADANHDGKISIEELESWLERNMTH